MTKYRVRINVSGFLETEIDANSAEEAKVEAAFLDYSHFDDKTVWDDFVIDALVDGEWVATEDPNKNKRLDN